MQVPESVPASSTKRSVASADVDHPAATKKRIAAQKKTRLLTIRSITCLFYYYLPVRNRDFIHCSYLKNPLFLRTKIAFPLAIRDMGPECCLLQIMPYLR